jgi:predicted dehydrogenase
VTTPPPLRIGILGAAAIAPQAIVHPARSTPGALVAAIAARDPARAATFAARHGIDHVHGSYEALLEDATNDAVYIPLPNGLHGAWTRRAIEAGKHVLCEKPFTANATEAADIAALADGTDRVVMEAFHWRYHPLMQRLIDLVGRGDLGEITSLDAGFCFPLLKPHDIRWSRDLAGGSLMDAGCYAVHQLRSVVGAVQDDEPTVVSALGKFTSGGVDRALAGTLRWEGGLEASLRCGFANFAHPVDLHLRVIGTDGEVLARNPIAPHLGGHLVVRQGARRTYEWADRTPSYTYQLRAFVDAVREGAPFPSTAADAVKNMAVIDALHLAAGVTPPRPTPISPATKTATSPTAPRPGGAK